MPRLGAIAVLTWLFWSVGLAIAQPDEFWIAPGRYQVAADEPVTADLALGSNFAGTTQVFAPSGVKRFDIVQGDLDAPVTGRPGATPALTVQLPAEGLAVIVHERVGAIKSWASWPEFQRYVAAKDFPWAAEDHAARGLPADGFRESVSRFAKALVAVGSGAGQDRPLGLEAEIVALANPYADDVTAGLPVQVLYQGKPRNGARVEVFSRGPGGAVDCTVLRTDMDGMLMLPVRPATEYLVSAVVLRPLSGNGKDGAPVWETLWASLTFRVPG